jgi:2-amino-4-hydroxy-6-hydroxymethyldihydropteridine diphosphokinase
MKNSNSPTVYIGLGSNMGDRDANLRRALAALIQTPNLSIRKISSFLENPAVGGPEDAPAFLNAAVEAQTTLPPSALMKRLLEIELQLGRTRRVKWEPRVIDLDLLLYGSSIISGDNLIVPHPLLHERRFVLQPLAEIAPKGVHPPLQMTVQDLLANLRN